MPIGAVAVLDGECIAMAHNLRESTQDPFAHAECLLLKKVSERVKAWRLEGLEVYVTCEPCPMCAGALLQSRIKRLVYGCKDPKAGVCGSLYNLLEDKRFNHQVEVLGGVLEQECAEKLSSFFLQLRKQKNDA